MEVVEIEQEELTLEKAIDLTNLYTWNPKIGPFFLGELVLRDLNIDGVIYKTLGKFRHVDYTDKDQAFATLQEEKNQFKGEYHWLFTRNQKGVYAFYRSAKMLKTLKKEYPERFA